MGKHYDNAAIPDVLRREFDVYDRIAELGIDLGTFEENVTSLADSPIAHMVFHESGSDVPVRLVGRHLPDER